MPASEIPSGRAAATTAPGSAAPAVLLSDIDRSGVALVVTDVHGRIRTATAAAAELLGIPATPYEPADASFLTRGMSAPVARKFRNVLADAQWCPGRPVVRVISARVGGRPVRLLVACAVVPPSDGPGPVVWLLHDPERPVGEAATALPVDAVREIACLRATSANLDDVVRTLASCALGAVGEADGVSVTLLAPGSLGATDTAVEDADRIQYELREGPCFDALRTGKPRWTGRSRRDPRWPRLAAALGGPPAPPEPGTTPPTGFASIVAVPLVTGDRIEGVLNLYAREPDAFDDTALRLAQILAGPLAATLTDARAHTEQAALVERLHRAVDTHGRVGQAIGILMARHRIDADAAFAMLRKRSNDTNRKLSRIAADLIEETAGSRAEDPA